MPFDPAELLRLLALGLFSGALGGLVGLGGSIIIIPVLTLFMHRDQQLSQAVAMIVNVFIAVPALLRHHRADAVRWPVMLRMLPFGLLLIVLGVEVSNRVDSLVLERIFGAFLLYLIVAALVRRHRDRQPTAPADSRTGWGPVGMVGGTTGFVSGLLGIGGGPIAIPMLQRFCRLPLRQGIATATAFMCITAIVGAACKNVALGQLTDPAGNPLGLSLGESLWTAACLAPTATLGALFGAGLTHTLPLAWIRGAFLVLLGWASVQMLGVF